MTFLASGYLFLNLLNMATGTKTFVFQTKSSVAAMNTPVPFSKSTNVSFITLKVGGILQEPRPRYHKLTTLHTLVVNVAIEAIFTTIILVPF